MRKETVNIDILITLRSGDRENYAIYQNNDWTFPENKEREAVEPTHMNIYQNNTVRKYFISMISQGFKRLQMKNQQAYISLFVAYLTFQRSNQEHQPRHDHSIPCKAV